MSLANAGLQSVTVAAASAKAQGISDVPGLVAELTTAKTAPSLFVANDSTPSGNGAIARANDTITFTPPNKENPLTFTTMLDSTNSSNAFSLSRGVGTDTVALMGPATVEHPLTFQTASSASGDGNLTRSGDTVTFTPPDKESPLTFVQGTELTNSVNFSRTGNTVTLAMPLSVEKPLTFQTASSASGDGDLTRSGETITYTPPNKEDPLTFQTTLG